MRLKHDLVLIDRHESGLGIYRFRYYGDPQTYVGVMAQDAQLVRPDVVSHGRDGYMRVNYERLGFRFETYAAWARDHGNVARIGSQSH